jgi:hypothetical protein
VCAEGGKNQCQCGVLLMLKEYMWATVETLVYHSAIKHQEQPSGFFFFKKKKTKKGKHKKHEKVQP